MPDKQLKCVACHKEFPFTEGEQRFFAERNYTEPKRCKPCRDAKKAEQQERDQRQQMSQQPVPDQMIDQYRERFNRKRGKGRRRENEGNE